MTQPERYEYLILGGGNGGGFLAWHLAGLGHRTAVIERRWIGGSCPNINCLPTKNEIWSAKVAHLTRSGRHFGAVTGPVSTDMAAVRRRKREMVEGMIALTLQAYEASSAELIMGSGRFTAPKTLEVTLSDGGKRVLTADKVFINVGTRAAIPEVSGLEAAQPMTNIEALELDRLPEHLIVLGGGYVGLELAQAFRRFGSRVTVIEHSDRIASREDPDVSAAMHGFLAEEGIDILVSARIDRVEGRSGREVRVAVRTPRGANMLTGTDILSAVGRIPNTSGIGLEAAGIGLDERGYVRVDERLQTTASDAWGIGECCTDHPQFTHVSFDDFRVIRDNLAGGNRTTKDRLIPYCLFTDPPLARVGLSELEAKQQGITVRVAKLPTSAVLRARTLGEQQGFLKALIAAHDDRILGFTMIGPEAGEVVAAVQTAMLARLPYTVLRDAILAHPTMAEGLSPLLSSVPAREA
ncbi:MAG TPA: FAD-dependent oxidoreductase [Steroidobacteraceae bacterium]|nr:FAD-dependent oxidoreductase [Steroidobacteraceae bacterium]